MGGSQVLSTLIDGIWRGVTSSPLVMAMFALILLVMLTRTFQAIRWAPLVLQGRDEWRTFKGANRAQVLQRAGNRCEHHLLWLLRCPVTKGLEVDHIHPHSRGGSTTVSNGQVLCKEHNRLKGVRIPFDWELRVLEQRRVSYAPGWNGGVVRREKHEGTGRAGQRSR